MEKLLIKFVNQKIGTEIEPPKFATSGSAGMDLSACIDESITLQPGERALVPTGIAIALPGPSYVALVFARSGLAIKKESAFQTASGLLTAITAEKSNVV